MRRSFGSLPMTEQANKIRDFDRMLHPLILSAIHFFPSSLAGEAISIDNWLHRLIQTPDVLEQVLELFPVRSGVKNLPMEE